MYFLIYYILIIGLPYDLGNRGLFKVSYNFNFYITVEKVLLYIQ